FSRDRQKEIDFR
nr:immunoglobulin heavy chain junction region [Macaca mulatta]MOX63116.1 immunoglobulin heavy chain junction region [Macaca mulatta]MOX63758.1 immunoglobulin heavy chain junction region [Macaca mulatta]